MFLAILLSSLPTILKLSGKLQACGVLVVHDGWWCSCVPCIFHQMFCQTHQCTLLHNLPFTSVPVYYSTFLEYGALSLGCTRRSLIVLPPVKYTSTPYLLQMFLQVSPRPFMYGTTMYDFLCCCFFGCFPFASSWCLFYSKPIRGICIFSGHYTDGLLLLLVTVWWNIQFCPVTKGVNDTIFADRWW